MLPNGYKQDAEAWGRVVAEIVTGRKPKVWRGVFRSLDEELTYIAWAARWAFHWANKANA